MNVLIEGLLNFFQISMLILVYGFISLSSGVLKCINALIMVHDKSNAI